MLELQRKRLRRGDPEYGWIKRKHIGAFERRRDIRAYRAESRARWAAVKAKLARADWLRQEGK
jgi:hypothetical protein